jgi:hypothetical protein
VSERRESARQRTNAARLAGKVHRLESPLFSEPYFPSPHRIDPLHRERARCCPLVPELRRNLDDPAFARFGLEMLRLADLGPAQHPERADLN